MSGDPNCPICKGTGFIIKVDENGNSFAERCECISTQIIKKYMELSGIPERYLSCEFDNYNPLNDSQKEALKISKKFVEHYPSVNAGLFFQGPVGVGKTHLSVAIIKYLIENKGVRAKFYDVRDLISSIQATIGIDNEKGIRILNEAYEVELLVLDDLGAHRISSYTEDIISKIINKRYNSNKITIFTSNYVDSKDFYDDPYEVKEETLESRIGYNLRSRIYEMAKLIKIEGDDFRKKYIKNIIQV